MLFRSVDSLASLTPRTDINTRAEYEAARQELRNEIRNYESQSGHSLTQSERLALIDAGLRGATLETVQQPGGNYTLTAYNSSNDQIFYQAGIITPNSLGKGTGTDSESRQYAKDCAAQSNYPNPIEYGHITGKNEGGGGSVSDRNGFPQSRHVNRGDMRTFQSELHKHADRTGQTVQTFTQLVYANPNTVPTSIKIYTNIMSSPKILPN